MGIRIDVSRAAIFVAASDKDAALEAVKSALSSDDSFGSASSLKEALEELGWYVVEDVDGNIVDVYFERSYRCSDDLVVAAIAPFVREGSTIEVVESDNHRHWRWKFTAGGVVRQEGRVVYDE